MSTKCTFCNDTRIEKVDGKDVDCVWCEPVQRHTAIDLRYASDPSLYATKYVDEKHYDAAVSKAAPVAPQAEAVITFDLDAAAKKLAECMDYPWEFMPEQGRNSMRAHAKSIIDAATAEPAAVEILQHKGSGEWHVCILEDRIWRGVNDMWFKKKADATKWAKGNGYLPVAVSQKSEGV